MPSLRDILARTPEAPLAPDLEVADDGGLFPPDPGAPVVLITAFGVAAADLDTALDHAGAGVHANARIVVLTDQPDFAPLRHRGVAFEYLPPPSARTAHADPRLWRTYLTERYEIIRAKWRPARVVAAGTSFDEFIGTSRP